MIYALSYTVFSLQVSLCANNELMCGFIPELVSWRIGLTVYFICSDWDGTHLKVKDARSLDGMHVLARLV